MTEAATKVELQAIASRSPPPPRGGFATLEELQTMLPSGGSGIYVVSSDGYWYYWNGSAWTAVGVYQTVQWQNALSALSTKNRPWSLI